MTVQLSLGDTGSADDLRSLRQWLAGEVELRGRISVVEGPPPPGALGPTLDAVLVTLAPEGVAAVLVQALVTWLSSRKRDRGVEQPGPSHSDVMLRVTRPDGGSLELSASRLAGLTAAEMRAEVEQLTRVLLLPPGRATNASEDDGPPGSVDAPESR